MIGQWRMSRAVRSGLQVGVKTGFRSDRFLKAKGGKKSTLLGSPFLFVLLHKFCSKDPPDIRYGQSKHPLRTASERQQPQGRSSALFAHQDLPPGCETILQVSGSAPRSISSRRCLGLTLSARQPENPASFSLSGPKRTALNGPGPAAERTG